MSEYGKLEDKSPGRVRPLAKEISLRYMPYSTKSLKDVIGPALTNHEVWKQIQTGILIWIGQPKLQ